MAEEIHQHKIVLATELLYISTKRINLAWRTHHQIFLLAIDGLECISRIALDILTAYTLNKFLYRRGDVVFSPSCPSIISTTYDFKSLFQKIAPRFKTNSTTGTLTPYGMLLAPCPVCIDCLILQGIIIMGKGTYINTNSTICTQLWACDNRLIKPAGVQPYINDFPAARRCANSASEAIVYI